MHLHKHSQTYHLEVLTLVLSYHVLKNRQNKNFFAHRQKTVFTSCFSTWCGCSESCIVKKLKNTKGFRWNVNWYISRDIVGIIGGIDRFLNTISIINFLPNRMSKLTNIQYPLLHRITTDFMIKVVADMINHHPD